MPVSSRLKLVHLPRRSIRGAVPPTLGQLASRTSGICTAENSAGPQSLAGEPPREAGQQDTLEAAREKSHRYHKREQVESGASPPHESERCKRRESAASVAQRPLTGCVDRSACQKAVSRIGCSATDSRWRVG